ncbi:glycosyl transferase [Litchfieldella qijiaojingensis]|uniref:Glycosyl transferase n=1 Tax=Litchfieldella qijiaojingensis TaxID=980347 RepID=A0ABQ2YR84_9GAMM|nr:glycosyltransferase family 4 protein [Halomonas qijiaojingensis]GGX92133.1 glycosyl transferase [Halomonas qijiaojingensis]
MTTSVTLIVAGDPAQLTGGYVYDARIAEVLRARGWRVEVTGLEGTFPEPNAVAAQALETALVRQADGARVVIDGLAMGALPEVVAAHGRRLDITALVHHPLADETGLDDAERTRFTISETRALSAVGRVIATSAFTARRLADFGVPATKVAVVEPGVESAPLAASVVNEDDERCQRLLCVATVTPRKGHEVLVEALASLTDCVWWCDCIGGLDRDPAHAERVAASIAAHGLDQRLRLLGERAREALGEAYHQADLFVLPSYYEGYGMVVTEALAHGLPVITTTGGALAHTLPAGAGLAVPPGDAMALSDALRQWFDEPDLRARLRLGAREARGRQHDWQDAGDAFAAALERPPLASPDREGGPP